MTIALWLAASRWPSKEPMEAWAQENGNALVLDIRRI
jgi:hypothetical protein